jgi:hypothetical protein
MTKTAPEWADIVRGQQTVVDTSTLQAAHERRSGVMISHGISKLFGSDGTIPPNHPERQRTELLAAELRKRGLAVHFPGEREGWIEPPDTPEAIRAALIIDTHQASHAGALVARSRASSGSDTELGVAVAAGVPVIQIWEGRMPRDHHRMTEEEFVIAGVAGQHPDSLLIEDRTRTVDGFRRRVLPQVVGHLKRIGVIEE